MLFGRSIGAAIHFHLRAAHESWGRLVVYIQTSNIRIRDILQNEENFKSFLVSPGYVCKARSHWCQRKVYYLSILLLPTFICLLSLKKSWWLYGWEQTANTEPAGTGSFSRSKSGCRELSRRAQCSTNKNILNWVTGCSCQSPVAAADISTKMMSSAFNI